METFGDYTLKGYDLDTVYAAEELSERAMWAACMASAAFDYRFPGWELYRRTVAGVRLFDRMLLAYAVGMARAVANSRGKHGRKIVYKRGPWVACAGVDALNLVVNGHFPVSLRQRAEYLGVDRDAYAKVRDTVAGGMKTGMENFRAELHYRYWKSIAPDLGEINRHA